MSPIVPITSVDISPNAPPASNREIAQQVEILRKEGLIEPLAVREIHYRHPRTWAETIRYEIAEDVNWYDVARMEAARQLEWPTVIVAIVKKGRSPEYVPRKYW